LQETDLGNGLKMESTDQETKGKRIAAEAVIL
jgi:hypothetical protein